MKTIGGNLLNIRQASRILNVHPDTLRRWENAGKIDSIRIGTRKDRRYRIEDIYSLASDADEFNAISSLGSGNLRFSDTEKIKTIIADAKYVFFDLSDTLMAPFPSRGHIFAQMAYKKGYNLDPNTLENIFWDLYEKWEQEKLLSSFTAHATENVRERLYSKLNSDVLISAGIPPEKRAEATEIGNSVYKVATSDPANWRVMPHAIEFLSKLKKEGKEMAIVDNWNHYLSQFVEKTALKPFFKSVISGGEIGIRKPDKKIFQLALSKMKAGSKETIYIGNRYIDDVIGPKSAGIMPVLFDSTRKYLNEHGFLKFYYFSELL